jgi:serine phosphatase RsbU (regulator of sigma subunit)
VSLEARFEQIEMDIAPGGCIAFFGEGVVSATDGRGDPLGRDQLHAAMLNLGRDGHKTPDDLVEQLKDYLGPGRDQLDDLTIITLQKNPPGGLRT